MTDLVTIDDILAAENAIRGRVLRTPAIESPALAAKLGVPVALKLELLQKTGCFKPRGITNRLLALGDAERKRGLITVSGGNHGIAIAAIGKAMGIAVTVVMSDKAPERSKARIRADGATLLLTADAGAAFDLADRECAAKGLTYIHSYDDPLIIAGHGTVGREFIADRPDLTDVLVSIGGGGLISGVAVALKAASPKIRIWGVETVGADAMSQALAKGAPVRITVSSIATTLGAPSVTERSLAHVQALVEEVMTVPDADAVAGVITLAEEAKLWAEPAAGCLIPAARRVIERVGREARLGLVICGGNVAFADVAGWVQRFGVEV
ncbi:MAG TPA: pyridoxal-phosphate dependent enzyme [Candidatus Binatia bacterium]|nr:pyridoxal-phosphate dependent enzyme [Candidatus Binatia bacterium]